MATQLPFTNGFYLSPILPLSAQRCVNWYPVIPEAPAVTDSFLYGTPGISQVANVGTQATTRGALVSAGIPYYVIGSKLYKIDVSYDIDGNATYTPVDKGTISGSGRVSMDHNGDQVVIVVPGGLTYVYMASTDLLYTVTDPAWLGPADNVSFIDGFFVFARTGTNQFFNSPLDDARGFPNGPAYNALDVSTAAADPDPIAGTVNYRNQLYVFGTETIEVYRNIARVPEPFQRINGFVIPKGLRAKNSLIRAAGTFAWVGGGKNETPGVYIFDGNNALRISTRPIEYILGRLSDDQLDTVSSWAYEDSGSVFIGFALPDTCLVYDLSTKRWHERQSTVSGSEVAWRGTDVVSAYGVTLCGDKLTGLIGVLSADIKTEYGKIIKRTFTTQPFDGGGSNIRVSRLEAYVENGIGLRQDIDLDGDLMDSGSDPQLGMEFSDDGGRTFGNMRFRSMGTTGQYTRRCVWYRNGQFTRNRVLRFVMSDPVVAAFLRLEAEIG